MSRNAYTASERRGIILIAVLVLLILGAGIYFSYRGEKSAMNDAIITEMAEYIDSSAFNTGKTQKITTKSKIGNKSLKRSKSKSGKRVDSLKNKKIRKRSPLDEPV